MQALMHDLGGVIDQLNPLSRQNQIVYLAWLAAYVFTAGAVWRCGRRWLRLVFLILLQFLSVGLFVSQANILILAIYLWRESLVVGLVAIVSSIWTFRTRRRKMPRTECGRVGRPEAARADGPVTAVVLASAQDFAVTSMDVDERLHRDLFSMR
jgi:hypothetical protein